jgi:pSer/pThr/pTyr-binding forkhead associated (FHA) protein
MAPPNPKSRSRSSLPPNPAAPQRRSPTVELPFNDEDVQPLRADDPRPQRVPQYPASVRRPARKAEEAIPTTVYDVSQDEEFQPTYEKNELSDPGYQPAFVYVERGPGQGQLVPIRQGAMVIGRASVSELRLQHPSISRRHCQITRLGERFYLKDLGSQNGTFVNRTRIATEVEVQPGDELSVGNALLKMRGPVTPAEAPVADVLIKPNRPSSHSVASSPVAPSYRRSKSRRHSSVTRIGLLGGAIGFGLAGVFTFAVLKVTRGPSYQGLPANAHTKTSGAAAAGGDLDAVSARIQKAMQDAAAKDKAMQANREPEVAPAVEAGDVKVRGPSSATAIASSAHRQAPARVASVEREPAAAPAPSKTKGNPEIQAKYEDGDVSAALDLARQDGDKEMIAKLQRFESAYEAAKNSVAAKDGTGAIKNFTAAMKADEQISKNGWGKYGAEVRKQLSSLYTLVGMKHLENESKDDAQKAFALAARLDPTNDKAREQLAKLGGEAPAAAAPKKKADDAFGDAPAPKKQAAPVKKAAARNAADAAFGD